MINVLPVAKNPSERNLFSNAQDLRVADKENPARSCNSPMVIKEATDDIFEQSMEAVEEYLR